ncbi:hypothetical protein BDV28DRAFT_147004 [Aspergillus coremiiformis]|uniref:Uncharacterized protein n=1 Tax=Aspergillus coremiiformis TaxID=138285 RepID=A0A5N6ZA59_9EURO|nr:hypothetical protein BDV28DRAFT_147004 [Aspergillus coremiiformis]
MSTATLLRDVQRLVTSFNGSGNESVRVQALEKTMQLARALEDTGGRNCETIIFPTNPCCSKLRMVNGDIGSPNENGTCE